MNYLVQEVSGGELNPQNEIPNIQRCWGEGKEGGGVKQPLDPCLGSCLASIPPPWEAPLPVVSPLPAVFLPLPLPLLICGLENWDEAC